MVRKLSFHSILDNPNFGNAWTTFSLASFQVYYSYNTETEQDAVPHIPLNFSLNDFGVRDILNESDNEKKQSST